MFSFIKRPLYALSNKIQRKNLSAGFLKERWTANFSKPEKSHLIIIREISYDAKLEKGSLFLGLKKENCMAWLETANRVYVDQVIEARFRFDCPGGYCAAGIMFRIMKKGTYYLALVSSKGYFRLDAVNDKVPRPLVGWTEAPDANGEMANLEQMALGIIAKGDHLIFTLNGKWIAEVNDSSIPGGHLGFALVSYAPELAEDSPAVTDGHVCQARLDYLSLDSRPNAVRKEYGRWNGGMEMNEPRRKQRGIVRSLVELYSGLNTSPRGGVFNPSARISAESRLCLAETFAALDRFDAAYDQVLKAWKQRENAVRSVSATYTDVRSGKELLFAARMASHLGLYETAEEYINICLSAEINDMPDSANETEVLAEKAKILSALNRFDELAAFLPDYIRKLERETKPLAGSPSHSLYALLGHAWWNLKNYEAAADAWDTAFNLDKDNGLYAENAADACEMLGKNEEALRYFLAGGNCFLRQADFEKLGALVPKLLVVGLGNQEAHRLAGEWAKGIGDFDRAEVEFALTSEEGGVKKAARGRKLVASKGKKEQTDALCEGSVKKPPRAGKAVTSKGNAELVEKTKPEKKPASKARTKTATVAELPEKATAKAKTKPRPKNRVEAKQSGSRKTAAKPEPKTKKVPK